jgi:hypothetical protein
MKIHLSPHQQPDESRYNFDVQPGLRIVTLKTDLKILGKESVVAELN